MNAPAAPFAARGPSGSRAAPPSPGSAATTAVGLVAAADVAIVVDASGVVVDAAAGGGGATGMGAGGADGGPASMVDAWVGRRFVETVTAESRGKIELLLREATCRSGRRPRAARSTTSPPTATTCRSRTAASGSPTARSCSSGRDLRAVVGAPAASRRDAAGARARLLAPAPRRDPLPPALPAVARGRAGRRRADAEVVDANASAGALFGVPAERIVGRTFPPEASGRRAADARRLLVARASTAPATRSTCRSPTGAGCASPRAASGRTRRRSSSCASPSSTPATGGTGLRSPAAARAARSHARSPARPTRSSSRTRSGSWSARTAPSSTSPSSAARRRPTAACSASGSAVPVPTSRCCSRCCAARRRAAGRHRGARRAGRRHRGRAVGGLGVRRRAAGRGFGPSATSAAGWAAARGARDLTRAVEQLTSLVGRVCAARPRARHDRDGRASLRRGGARADRRQPHGGRRGAGAARQAST